MITTKKQQILIRFIKFSMIGIFNTFLHFVFFYIFYKIFSFHYSASQITSFILVNLVTFPLNKIWTFEDRSKITVKKLFLYYNGRFLSLFIALAQTIFLVEYLNVNPFICQLLSIWINVSFNFIFAQIYVFIPKQKELSYYIKKSFKDLKMLSPYKPINVHILVPVFKEQKRLYPKDSYNPNGEDFVAVKIEQLKELFSKNNKFNWNLIFIDDGDYQYHSGKLINQLLISRFPFYKRSKQVSVLFLDEIAPRISKRSRKGGAIIEGIKYLLKKKLNDEDIIIYTDADVSSDLRISGSLIAALQTEYDAAITSRWHLESSIYNRGFIQKISSWIYNMCVYLILGLNFTDTQNGFKAFKIKLLKNIMPYAKDAGFAFDTELLMLSEIFKAKIKEIPIYWKDSTQETNIKMGIDSYKMIKSLFYQRLYKKYLSGILK